MKALQRSQSESVHNRRQRNAFGRRFFGVRLFSVHVFFSASASLQGCSWITGVFLCCCKEGKVGFRLWLSSCLPRRGALLKHGDKKKNYPSARPSRIAFSVLTSFRSKKSIQIVWIWFYHMLTKMNSFNMYTQSLKCLFQNVLESDMIIVLTMF